MVDAKFKENNLKKHDEIDSILGFKTPILKGFLTEMGVEAASLGMQLYGGHGYIKSNKQEQIYRDVRISSIWEGTTGIQALDLLGRKIFEKSKFFTRKFHIEQFSLIVCVIYLQIRS
jgi:hypothetical protein